MHQKIKSGSCLKEAERAMEKNQCAKKELTVFLRGGRESKTGPEEGEYIHCKKIGQEEVMDILNELLTQYTSTGSRIPTMLQLIPGEYFLINEEPIKTG